MISLDLTKSSEVRKAGDQPIYVKSVLLDISYGAQNSVWGYI